MEYWKISGKSRCGGRTEKPKIFQLTRKVKLTAAQIDNLRRSIGGESPSPCASLSNDVLTGRSATSTAAGRGNPDGRKSSGETRARRSPFEGSIAPGGAGGFLRVEYWKISGKSRRGGRTEKPKIFQLATKAKLTAAQIDNLWYSIGGESPFPCAGLSNDVLTGCVGRQGESRLPKKLRGTRERRSPFEGSIAPGGGGGFLRVF